MKSMLTVVTAFLLLLTSTTWAGNSYSTSFETEDGYVVGETLYGQNGWSGGDWTDSTWNKIKPGEGIVDDVARTGTNSWYFPGGPTTEGAGTPFSPPLDGSVGAPSHADYNAMTATLWFKPADPSGDGSALNIYQGDVPGTGRVGFNIYIDSTSDGLDFGTYRWADGTFVWEQIATGLPLDQWHSITIDALFKDDFLNDEITYTINKGTAQEVASTGNTWTHPWFDINHDEYRPGDSLKFMWSRNAPSEATGFYFDDISYSAWLETDDAPPIPEPAGLSLLGMALLGLKRKRRR